MTERPPIRISHERCMKMYYRLERLERLPMWVVYIQGTADYPGVFVARLWVCLPEAKPSRFVMTHAQLVGLRAMLPPGLHRFPRHRTDPAVVLENWI